MICYVSLIGNEFSMLPQGVLLLLYLSNSRFHSGILVFCVLVSRLPSYHTGRWHSQSKGRLQRNTRLRHGFRWHWVGLMHTLLYLGIVTDV